MAIAPLAIAGMAMAAAGTGINYMQKKAAEKRAKGVLEASQKRVDRNTALANEQWQTAAKGVTRDQQEADQAAATADRQAKYDSATADAASVALTPQSDAPQVVKSESAKQLGDQLSKARDMMAARARLGGWADTMLDDKLALNRSADEIRTLGNFSLGDARAAQEDAAATAAKKGFPIGDILMGVGSMMSMGAGAAGGLGAAGAGTAAAGAAGGLAPNVIQAGPMGFPVQMAAPEQSWWTKAANWATTPVKWS